MGKEFTKNFQCYIPERLYQDTLEKGIARRKHESSKYGTIMAQIKENRIEKDDYYHVTGILGETCYSLMSGLSVDYNIYENKGDLFDFKDLEIKTSTYQNENEITLKLETPHDINKCKAQKVQAVMLFKLVDTHFKNLIKNPTCYIKMIGWTSLERFLFFSKKYGTTNYISSKNNLINYAKDLCPYFPLKEGHEEMINIAKQDNINILNLTEMLISPATIEQATKEYILKNPLERNW